MGTQPIGWLVPASLWESCPPAHRWPMSQQWSTLAWTQEMLSLPFLPGWPSMMILASRWVAGNRGAEGHERPAILMPLGVLCPLTPFCTVSGPPGLKWGGGR